MSEKTEVVKTSGGYAVVDTGTLIMFDENSGADFDVKFDENSVLSVKIRFEDEESGRQDVRGDVKGDVISLVCVNFNNPLGTGLKRAMKIGDYNGKGIYFVFVVRGQKPKTLEYTIFMEE